MTGATIMNRKRTASIRRDTRETRVALELDLDGAGKGEVRIGIPFLEHMLDQVARHGMLDLKIHAEGDLAVDAHHTVEDVGICLGQAVRDALGDKSGIRRFGHAYVPLDEALSRVVVDCSGRPGLEYNVEYPRARIGDFDVDLVREFFQALVNHAGLTVHVDNLRGRNAHHIAETLFKGFGRALRMAVEPDARMQGAAPSTKGSL
jgi:imidazoleglycerol-phosphate dehydratase